MAEAVCQLFDDSGLGDALEAEDQSISGLAWHKLTLLRNALSKVPNDISPESQIDTREMDHVRGLAADALHLLQRTI